jgi:hypothetical protein
MCDPTVNADVEEAIGAVRSVFDRHPEYLQPALLSLERLKDLHEFAVVGLYVMRNKVMAEDIRMIICELVLGKVTEGGGLAGLRRRGRHVKGAYWRRDLRIAQMVARVAERGFPPTRNVASRTESACSIVSTALKSIGIQMSERTIEDIWNNVRIKHGALRTDAQLEAEATRGDRREAIVWEYLQELQRGHRRRPGQPPLSSGLIPPK